MYTKRNSIHRSIVALSLILALASCGEKVPLDNDRSLYEISFTGKQEIGEPMKFQSSAPIGAELQWKFSDGSVYTVESPQHTFYSISRDGDVIVEDTVTLIVNNAIYIPNIKTFLLKPGVSKVAGMNTWTGGYLSVNGDCCPGLTSHVLNDTAFPVAAVDDYTVNTWGVDLPYLVDSNCYSTVKRAGWYNTTMVKYTKDTIYFVQRSGSEDGWIEVSYYR